MFQNGLLATFIPEIIMVLGYILCLLTPGYNQPNTKTEQTQLVTHVTSNVPQQLSTYKLTYQDFQVAPEINEGISCPIPPFVEKDTFQTFKSPFSTSDGLSYVDFSRPPPTILS